MRRVTIVTFLAASLVLAQEDDLADLRRPLELPTLAESGECPASIGSVGVVPIEAQVFGLPPELFWFGSGPVYVLGGSDAIEEPIFQQTSLSAPEPFGYRFKASVVSNVSYSGPILFRGRELETGHEMTFSGGESELILSGRYRYQRPTSWGGNPDNWRMWPTFIELPEPGCYGVQIDTLISSEVLIVALRRLSSEEAQPN